MPEITRYMKFQAIYHFAWTFHRVYETLGAGNQTMGWQLNQKVVIIGLSLLSCCTRSLRLWILTILVVLVADFQMMPYIWDSEYWCIITDLSLLMSISHLGWKRLCSPAPLKDEEKDSVVLCARECICMQMRVFYSAAMFWKLTWDFLDPHSSCAPIFTMQLIDAILPSSVMLSNSVARILVNLSPVSVLLLEAYVAFALWMHPARGVIAALVLHFFIAMCPPPENVATFSLMCASRLVCFIPTGCERMASWKRWTPLEIAFWIAGIAVAAQWASHPDFFDLACPLFILILPLVWKAACLDNLDQSKDSTRIFPEKRHSSVSYAYVCSAAVALTYAYLLIPLGLMDQGQPHMYANLRLHGGTNHILGVPTSLLQSWYQDSESVFGGGIIRIESSTSTILNSIYPSDYTDQMTLRSRQFLLDGGHSSRNFNAMLTVCTSSEAPWLSSHGPFIRYTIPAHEFRRVLAILREEEESSFKIEFTVLSGHGDETWRAVTNGRRISIVEEPTGKSSCKVVGEGECGPFELPNLPALPWWASKFMLFEPYPILENDHKLHCFGP